jgi:hypothetical protein
VGLLAALPLAAPLLRLQEGAEAAKDDRGQKPHKRHKRHKRRERDKRKTKQRQRKHKCHPESVDKLCAGKCSFVTNKCGKQVDCGACTCAEGCPQCQTCDPTSGLCVADASQNRSVCAGSAGATSVCCQGACCDGCCGADGTCGACLAFVTSTTQNGNLGGLTGADAICQARAAAGGLPGASEPNTYKAWLSDSTGSPATRFRCTEANCSGQGYTRVDETPIASDWDALTDGELEFAISLTELGTYLRPFDSGVWTNTLITGEADPFPSHCSNWGTGSSGVGYSGVATAFDEYWTDTNGGVVCGALLHLYCFQQS